MIYDEYIRPRAPSEFLESVRAEARGTAAEMEERRHRFRMPFKLMTDLAYNANVPATLNIKSFVPPDMPDPVSLPMHLFQPIQFPNPALDAHGDAVRQAYTDLLARRVEAGERFFYDSQTFERLPDIGSFTLRDALTVMEWPEGKSFRSAQHAALRFERAEELETLMRIYWTTVKDLHHRLEGEAKQRQRWRLVGSVPVKLSISVIAHVMAKIDKLGVIAQTEGIEGVQLVTVRELEDMIARSEVTDPFTLAGLLIARTRGLFSASRDHAPR
jgi:hypothetical protein